MLVMGIKIDCKRFNHRNCYSVELIIDVHIDAVVCDFNATINSCQIILQPVYVFMHGVK